MKDIDTMLSQQTPKPKKQLDDNFTNAVIAELSAQPRRNQLDNFLGFLRQQSFRKASALSLASVVLISGTAGAALWLQPTITPTITKNLPSGNHIVGYDTKNCNYFSELKDGQAQPTHDIVYYEIRRDSSLTDQDIQNALLGICEENINGLAISAAVKHLPSSTLSGSFSTLVLRVEATTNSTITVSPDPHYAPPQRGVNTHLTYTQFAKDLVVYDKFDKVHYGNLKVGDTVQLLVAQTNPQPFFPFNQQALNDPSNITIIAIVKVAPITEDPAAFYQGIASDFVRAEPCKTSPSGFCRAYNFAH